MNELAEKVYRVLEKHIGFIAKAILINNCKSIGRDANSLKMEDMGELFPLLERRARYFLGNKPEDAMNVMNEIKVEIRYSIWKVQNKF